MKRSLTLILISLSIFVAILFAFFPDIPLGFYEQGQEYLLSDTKRMKTAIEAEGFQVNAATIQAYKENQKRKSNPQKHNSKANSTSPRGSEKWVSYIPDILTLGVPLIGAILFSLGIKFLVLTRVKSVQNSISKKRLKFGQVVYFFGQLMVASMAFFVAFAFGILFYVFVGFGSLQDKDFETGIILLYFSPFILLELGFLFKLFKSARVDQNKVLT